MKQASAQHAKSLVHFSSSSIALSTNKLPQHIAIVMDGNGRWANQRLLSRVSGHKQGMETVKRIVTACVERKIGYLTLFAFSSENWRRPAHEVAMLMKLFANALDREVEKLAEQEISLRFIGDLQAFSPTLQKKFIKAEQATQQFQRMVLTICVNYGGRWDIIQAMRKMALHHSEKNYSEELLSNYLALSYAPEPDLFIRTSGEQRISNFLLWQMAYTELYFTDVLWPDFDAQALDQAIATYQKRERRFGQTSEQLHNFVFQSPT